VRFIFGKTSLALVCILSRIKLINREYTSLLLSKTHLYRDHFRGR